jgi:amino acid transporter
LSTGISGRKSFSSLRNVPLDVGKYLIISPNQIVAGALVIRFWNDEINSAAWISILIVFVIAINCFGIKAFGEVEFWLSLIKIITLTGLIILGLVIDLGGIPGQERIGFRYWKNGKAFKSWPKAVENHSLGKFCGFVNGRLYPHSEGFGKID